MMGGMGEEQEFKVTLTHEPKQSAAKTEAEEEEGCEMDDPFAMMGGMGEEQEFKVTCLPGANAEEEEEACDMDDPFAMMGGMGEEQEFNVTINHEPKQSAAKAEAGEGRPSSSMSSRATRETK